MGDPYKRRPPKIKGGCRIKGSAASDCTISTLETYSQAQLKVPGHQVHNLDIINERK